MPATLAWGIGGVSQTTVPVHLDSFTATGIGRLPGAMARFSLASRDGLRGVPRGRPDAGAILTVAIPRSAATVLARAGFGDTSVADAGFFVKASAVITPFASWAPLRQRPPLWVFPASLCASALAFSVWMVAIGEHVARHRDSAGIACSQLAVCGFACLVLSFMFCGLPPESASVEALPGLPIIGILAKGLGLCLCASVQQHVSAGAAAMLISAGAPFAMLLINEMMTPGQAAGALLVLASIAIVTLRTSQPAQPSQAANR
ncbi:EamA family transporter [Aestuariivirga sp.]|uniref:EamA family transporter n=1 Tax=Aestuariivirga sp. TaxID=2650926 RepID=UPI0038D1E2BE